MTTQAEINNQIEVLGNAIEKLRGAVNTIQSGEKNLRSIFTEVNKMVGGNRSCEALTRDMTFVANRVTVAIKTLTNRQSALSASLAAETLQIKKAAQPPGPPAIAAPTPSQAPDHPAAGAKATPLRERLGFPSKATK